MPVINILSPHLADMIAAGEVVERPASVIKELVENSFDAGARNVTVEIRGGGATYIRVSDDGCGMSPEDAGVAFLRHATSKLHDEQGLESIATMGFRGEALAAISAVSRVELTTRRKGDESGTRVELLAGDIQSMRECGCPEGTTMVVRDLFYNTPARFKFLKSDRSEAAACQQAALRCALGRPGVSVRFIRDGEEQFFSPGDGRADSCVYTLLGRDLATSMLPMSGENERMKVSGYVSSPSMGRGNRGAQYFFCNGRFIRSALLQSVLEQAYKNSLLVGRYPACVLYLDLSFAQVDVNVHPAKTEVKFTNEKAVFDLVYYAVLSALKGEDRTAPAADSAPRQSSVPKADFYQSMSSADFRANGYSAKSASAEKRPVMDGAVFHSPKGAARENEGGFAVMGALRSAQTPYQTSIDLNNKAVSPNFPPKDDKIVHDSTPQITDTVENPVQNVEKKRVPDHKIVGEALKTYIIVEMTDDSLILIDKHAAHERMNFDRLRTMTHALPSQTLLTPVAFRPGSEDIEVLESRGELLSQLGFEIEPYGSAEYIIRGVPLEMDSAQALGAVEEICEKLRREKESDVTGARDEILHTVACKAAIKAGWDTDRRELQVLVDAVLSGEVKYCPHGRPVSITVTRRDLDKLFKRIV